MNGRTPGDLGGRLLVATPLLGDSNFERTVVLILAHNDDGAFGVVLNRPSDMTVAVVAPEWAEHVSAPAVEFIGGPVAQGDVIGLGRGGLRVSGPIHPDLGGLGTIDLNEAPTDGTHPCDGLRLFAGGAGWAPNQLEDELREGAWWVLPSVDDDVLTSDPDSLWVRVLRRQRGDLAWFANHPLDPSQN